MDDCIGSTNETDVNVELILKKQLTNDCGMYRENQMICLIYLVLTPLLLSLVNPSVSTITILNTNIQGFWNI